MNGQDLDGQNVTVNETQSHEGGGYGEGSGFCNGGGGEGRHEGGGYNHSSGYGDGGSGGYRGGLDRGYGDGGDGGSRYSCGGSGDGNWRN